MSLLILDTLSDMDSLFIGLSTNTPCHNQHYDKNVGCKDFKHLKKTDLKLTVLRSNISVENTLDKNISFDHYAHPVTFYAKLCPKLCSIIFGIHDGKARKGTKDITLKQAEVLGGTYSKTKMKRHLQIPQDH